MATGYMGSGDVAKGLYAAPEGLMDMPTEGPEIEIEIEDPERVTLGLGDIEIDLAPKAPTADDFDANLAEYMDDKELAQLVTDLVGDFDKDINDRKEWMQT